MIINRARIVLYRFLQALDNKFCRVAWIIVSFAILLIRLLSLGYLRVWPIHWVVLLHRLQGRVVGVKQASERELTALEKQLRARAEALRARLLERLKEPEEAFHGRLATAQGQLHKAALAQLPGAEAADKAFDWPRWQSALLESMLAQLGMDLLLLGVEWFHRRQQVLLHVEQIMGALALLDGCFIEMKNGEGKTFTAAVAAATLGLIVENARKAFAQAPRGRLAHKPIVVLTANDYLVRRDFTWLRKLYEEMGISCGYLVESMARPERVGMYEATVVYVTGSAYGFDLLRDSTRKVDEAGLHLSPFRVVIDEADQLLLDEAMTPHLLVGGEDLRFESAIPEPWVQLIADWRDRYFVPNVLYQLDYADPSGYQLMPAARLLVHAQTTDPDWKSFSRQPMLKSLAMEVVCCLEALGRSYSPAEQVLRAVKARLGGASLVSASIAGEFPEPSREFDNWLGGTPWKRLVNRLFPITQFLFLLVRLFGWSRSLVLSLSPGEREECLALFSKLRTRYLSSFFGARKSMRQVEDAIQDVVPRALVGASLDAPLTFWRGIQHILFCCSSDQDPAGAPDFGPSEWVIQSCFPLFLNVVRQIEELREDPFVGQSAADLADLLRLLLLVQKALVKHPRGATILSKLGLDEDQGLFTMLATNRLADENGHLTESGRLIAKYLVASTCHEHGLAADYSPAEVFSFLHLALHAQFGLTRDKDYLVDDGRIYLVNQVTGRREESKHFGQNIHPFVLLKEELSYEPTSPVLRRLAVASFVNRCDRIVGLSGTMITADEELRWLYRSGPDRKRPSVVRIPEHRPRRLKDHGIRVCQTTEYKYRAVVAEVYETHRLGRPVLVIADSVAESEAIHAALMAAPEAADLIWPIPLLNAGHPESEEEIISRAGEAGAITVATQMAGRGTDIILSGEAASAGGLHVVLTTLPINDRVAMQAKGRAGRQGDLGSAVAYLSYDDWAYKNNSVLDWVRNTFPDEGYQDGHMVTDPVLNEQHSYAVRSLMQRQQTTRLDELLAPVHDRLLGWREATVSGAPENWRAALADIFSVYLRLLGSAPSTQSGRWRATVDQVMQLLNGPGLTLEEQRARLGRLWRGQLMPDESAALLAQLGRSVDDAGRREAVSQAMWLALRRVDLGRFSQIQDELYRDCPRGSDPDFPRLDEYLRRLQSHLLRGIDEALFLRELHKSNIPWERQLWGAKKLLDATVLTAIKQSQPNENLERASWRDLGIPEWMRSAEAYGGDPAEGARVLTACLGGRADRAYRCRARLTQVIDKVLCELFDEIEVTEQQLRRESDPDPEKQRLNWGRTLIQVAMRWQNECAVRLVECCSAALADDRPLARETPREAIPETARQTLLAALKLEEER